MEFRKERIRVKLQAHPESRPNSATLRKTTPPLHVEVSGNSPFILQESLPSIRAGKFMPPSPDPFSTAQKLHLLDTRGGGGAKSSIFGALVFSDHQEGNQAFIVICGLSSSLTIFDISQNLEGERGVDVRAFLSYGWWQDATGSSPFCLVMSWRAFTVIADPGAGTESGDDDDDYDYSEDGIRYPRGIRGVNGRSLVGLVRRFSGQLERFVLREKSSLDLGAFQIKARIKRVTATQRHAMKISVEIVRRDNVG